MANVSHIFPRRCLIGPASVLRLHDQLLLGVGISLGRAKQHFWLGSWNCFWLHQAAALSVQLEPLPAVVRSPMPMP